MFEVRQTETFASWLRALKDANAVARIAARIRRLELGNLGDVKPIGEGVSELRIDYGPGYRIYFVQQGNTVGYPPLWWRQADPEQGHQDRQANGEGGLICPLRQPSSTFRTT